MCTKSRSFPKIGCKRVTCIGCCARRQARVPSHAVQGDKRFFPLWASLPRAFRPALAWWIRHQHIIHHLKYKANRKGEIAQGALLHLRRPGRDSTQLGSRRHQHARFVAVHFTQLQASPAGTAS